MIHDIRYPFMIITCMYTVGLILGLFIPETLYQKLPNSLKEAKSFGVGQVIVAAIIYKLILFEYII